jgi:formiminoglutamate deiminase
MTDTHTNTFHCELAWLGGDHAVADVLVEVAEGRISRVSPSEGPVQGAVRLHGLTVPGFANVHSHAFQRAMRGRTQSGSGTFWTWRDQMYTFASMLDPDSYFLLARAVFGEMVLAGVSCVGEFHYLHHAPGGQAYADPNEMGTVLLAAAREAGLRITLLDACYLQGGIGKRVNETQRRFSDGSAEKWAARAGDLLRLQSADIRIGAAVHSVRAVDPDAIAMVAQWSRMHNVPLHAHISEQQAENDECLAAYGMSPAELLGDRGAIGESFTGVHLTCGSAGDVRLLGSARATVCFCPTTERDLADGIGPSVAAREAGASLALGSDSQAVIDMLEEARALEMNERLASRVRGNHSARGLLAAATVNGHRSLGWRDAGRIEEGCLADLVTIRMDSVRTAGAGAQHALENAVFAATSGDIHHVVIGGRVVVRDGAHISLDVAAERNRHVIRA